MKIAERGRRQQSTESKRKGKGRDRKRDYWWAIHNSVRIMSLTTVALTLPGVDRFQMSLELERCQVLLSSVDNLNFCSLSEAFNRVGVCVCVCLCIPVCACRTLWSSILTPNGLTDECVSCSMDSGVHLGVCVLVAFSDGVYKDYLSVSLWGRNITCLWWCLIGTRPEFFSPFLYCCLSVSS